jgi:hypothetical protein
VEGAPKNDDGSLKCQANGKVIDAYEQTCHLFLTDGRLQYLGDCTHALAGQTVPLPELPAWA